MYITHLELFYGPSVLHVVNASQIFVKYVTKINLLLRKSFDIWIVVIKFIVTQKCRFLRPFFFETLRLLKGASIFNEKWRETIK